MEKKNLNIKLHNSINQYLEYALKLCIIFTDKNLYGWYLGKFSQLYAIEKPDKSYNINYAEYLNTFAENLFNNEIYAKSFISKTDFLDFIKNKLKNDFYMIVYLSDSIIPFRDKLNTIHPYLIYGYDNNTGQFKLICYNNHNILIKASIDYGVMEEAFYADGYFYDTRGEKLEKHIHALKLRKTYGEYIFNIEKFLKNLNNYLYSNIDDEFIFEEWGYNATVNSGIDTINSVISGIKEDVLSYTNIHVLTEHKKFMYEKLLYIKNVIREISGFDILIQEYEELIDQHNKIRMLYIKNLIKMNLIDNTFKQNIVKQLSDTYLTEKDLTSRIYCLLENFLTNDDEKSYDLILNDKIDSKSKDRLYDNNIIEKCLVKASSNWTNFDKIDDPYFCAKNVLNYDKNSVWVSGLDRVDNEYLVFSFRQSVEFNSFGIRFAKGCSQIKEFSLLTSSDCIVWENVFHYNGPNLDSYFYKYDIDKVNAKFIKLTIPKLVDSSKIPIGISSVKLYKN